jgi:cell division septation protein DedD
MTGSAIRSLLLAAAASALLAGCQEGSGGPLASKAATGADATAQPVAGAKSVKLVDRDVEAPQVFQTTDQALWDGRPSLGGVWVASPDAKDPERVILRNPANGKFVIGALFRREIDNPGPKLQISSDAASALGLLAGEPGKISVTALRREEAKVAPDASKPILDAAETVSAETTADSITGAAAALDRVDGKGKPTSPAAAPTITSEPIPAGTINPNAGKAVAKPAPAAKPEVAAKPTAAASGGGTIQIGIFSVEANAKRAAAKLKSAGVTAEVRSETSQGKPFWSVTAKGDKAALAKVKKAGFKDAYFLKG